MLLAVPCDDGHGAHTDLVDCASAAADHDDIAGLDRSVHQQNDPGDEISECLLQTKADGQTGRAREKPNAVRSIPAMSMPIKKATTMIASAANFCASNFCAGSKSRTLAMLCSVIRFASRMPANSATTVTKSVSMLSREKRVLPTLKPTRSSASDRKSTRLNSSH